MLLVLAAFVPAEEAGAIPGYLTVNDWIERIVFVPVNPLYLAVAYPLLLLVVLGYLAGRKRLFEEPDANRRGAAGDRSGGSDYLSGGGRCPRR